MQNHINLRRTHRLLFRLIMIKSIFAIVLGLGVLIVPGVFINNSTLPTVILATQLWAGLWALIAGFTVFALYKLSYNLVRLGLILLTSLYAMFGTSALFNYFVNFPNGRTLFTAIVFGFMALTCLSILAEPPINPSTAVKKEEND